MPKVEKLRNCCKCKEPFTGKSSFCPSCWNAYMRERYDAREKRDRNLRQNHNITLEQYEAMAEAQGNVCAVCKQPEMRLASGRKGRMPKEETYLHVDHDHETGVLRQLLCSECNIALGHLHDSPQRISALLDYVLKYKSEGVIK